MSKTTANTAANAISSKDEFVAQYLARRLNGEQRTPKRSLFDRLVSTVANKTVDMVADSKTFGGRIVAGWEAAEDSFDQAYAVETQRQAERAAARLGLK